MVNAPLAVHSACNVFCADFPCICAPSTHTSILKLTYDKVLVICPVMTMCYSLSSADDVLRSKKKLRNEHSRSKEQ